MPTFLTVSLFAASFVLPTIVALGVAVYVRGYRRYFVGPVGIMLAIGFHAGIAQYSNASHPEWWDNASSTGGLIVVAYIFVGFIGNIVGVVASEVLARDIDKQHPFVARLRRVA